MSGAGTPGESWADACLAAWLLAIDPIGIGGACVHASPGPVRDRWLSVLTGALPGGAPVVRLPLHATDDRLLGGLDLAATLRAGRPVAERGILAAAHGGVLVVPMAERVSPGAAARIASALDTGSVAVQRDGLALAPQTEFGLVLLDEGLDEERPPAALAERTGIHLDLSALSVRSAEEDCGPANLGTARALWPDVVLPDEILTALCRAAFAAGIDSLRAPFFASRVARAAAALGGRREVTSADAAVAARLVLAPRATRVPSPEPMPDAGEAPDQNQSRDDAGQDASDAPGQQRDMPDELVLAATVAAIPPGLLDQLRSGPVDRRHSSGGGAGAAQRHPRHGRPAGTTRGDPRRGARLDLIETLRAAAPWQPLRREPGADRTVIRRDDFRIKRFKRRSETTTIFVVDASGSAAAHRLAEAKGAVELLLAECYVRRDRVALIAFRGASADLLLPPTRSLTRAKRSLAALPGGGGTPLALAIDNACGLAETLARGGSSPVLVFLTDGRANIARNGTPGRERASEDAHAAARRLRAAGRSALMIDTSPRPSPGRICDRCRHGRPLCAASGCGFTVALRSRAARDRAGDERGKAGSAALSDLVWGRDGRSWPNREASSFVRAAGMTWHVQQMGQGPVLLLAHGTGASTHSWRDLAPLLARHFTVVAPDLPGHGFTTRPDLRRLSLSGMAADLASLLDELGLSPDLAIGHSAGAAIVCRMILDGRLKAKGAVSLNGALTGFRGAAGHLFSPLAKLLAVNPVVPRLVALTMSGRRSVQRLIRDTGSTIDESGLATYGRLVASPTHVGSALGMMASWDLDGLERDLAKLPVPLLLLVGARDRAIPPSAAEKVRRIVPNAILKEQRGLGHLAHEEQAAPTCNLILDFAREVGVVAA